MTTPERIFLMQQTYATLFSLTNKLQVQGDKHLAPLTSRQFMAMVAVIHLPKHETTLNNIARKLGTTKQNVQQLVSATERKGYVATVPSPQDKRAVNVVITESGAHVMAQSGKIGMELFDMLFKDFSNNELDALWASLKKLYRYDGDELEGFEEEAVLEPGIEP